MAGRNFRLSVAISLILVMLLSLSTAPAMSSPHPDETSINSSGAREGGVTLTPDADSTIIWHEHEKLRVEYQGEEPDIDSASAEVSSDLTGVISGTTLSVVGDEVRIFLPERLCENSDETYPLCPEGETISVELSGVVNATGAALADQSWSFSVGLARISFVSPVDGAYLNTTSFDVAFASENHTAQFPGPHIHFMYDEHGANSKMHKSMEPLRYTGLPEGQTLLIIDLRDDSHKWLGHDESIAAITVTIDTIAPSIVNEQLAPMVDANSVPINSTVAVRFSEMILEGASVTLANESGEVTGSMNSGIAGSKSELILTPSSNLSEGTLYTVTVDGVKDMAGNPMQAFSYSFTTVGGEEGEGSQNTAASGDEEEGWLERWGDLTLGIGAVIASLIGWMFIRKSKAKVRWYLEELDRVVGELGENVSELEQQLDRMKKDVAEDYRKGRLDEKQYQLVDQKLDEASNEARKQEAEEMLGSIPDSLAAKLEQALADGRIDSAEIEQVLSQGDELDEEQQSGLEEMLKRWKVEDEEP